MLSRLKTKFNRLSLFCKLYIFIVALLIFVVSLAEGFLEPTLEVFWAKYISTDTTAWLEVIIWIISILIPSAVCGYMLTRILSNKLGKMAKASKAIAMGNIEVRLPEIGNENDAFDSLSHSFNEMANSIKQQQNNDRRLLADISHEMRSPLTRMSVAVDLLSVMHQETKSQELILRLAKEIDSMNESISMLMGQARDKLLYAREKKALDLSCVLNELADDFSFQAEAQNIKINRKIEGSLCVYANKLLLERMVGNVLSNALFYGPEKKSIEFSAWLEADNILINIRDYGQGVPESDIEDIFRAFYRVDTSRTRQSGGVGLGLALAKEVSIIFGGNISAKNAHPGLSITITLPVFAEE